MVDDSQPDDSVFAELLAANARYSRRFPLADLQAGAARGFALVTCMDSRIEPLEPLGLRPGDAKILRNAGGRVTPDVLRSLVLATTFLSVTNVAVMHHTRCALGGQSEADIRKSLSRQQEEATEGWEFAAMPDLDAGLRADVARIRSCTALGEGISVEGWRYSVETGGIDQVVPRTIVGSTD